MAVSPTASWTVIASLAVCGVLAVQGVPLSPPSAADAVLPCYQNNSRITSDLNLCIANGIEHFLKTAKHGLPDIGFEPLDPMFVKHLELEQGSGKVAVSFDFQDVRFKGFSASEVHSVRMNVNDKKLEVSLTAPVYEIDGLYSCSGGVYELPISSSGRFTVTMRDVTSAWMLYFLTKKANNETAVGVNRFIVDLSPASVVYRFDKKFDGENSLGIGEAMDEFMNENALEIYNDVKPKLMKMLSGLFLDMANAVLMSRPAALDLPA